MTLNIFEKIAKPFYKNLQFFPFSINLIKYPIYKQVQLYYNTLFSYRYTEGEYVINPLKNIKFKMVCNGSKGFVEMALIMGGIYEKDITRFIANKLKSAEIFLDIGANIGYYSIIAGYVMPKSGEIISFEPVVETYDRLVKNIKLNNLYNVKPLNIALGNKNEFAEIKLTKELGHSSMAGTPIDYINKTEKIKINRLNDLVNFNSKKIFIKIDVEGYELEVLRGMKNVLEENDCEIIFEFTPSEHNLSINNKTISLDIYDFFENINYEIFYFKNEKEQILLDLKSFKKISKNNEPVDLLARKKMLNK